MADENTSLTTATSQEEAAPSSALRTTRFAGEVPDLESELAAELGADAGKPAKAKPTRKPAPRVPDEDDDEEDEEESEDDDEDEDEESESDDDGEEESESDDPESDDDDEEAEEESDTDEEEDDESDSDDEEENDDKGEKTDKAPGRNGLKDLPKWAQERVSKLSSDVRTLRSRLAEAEAATSPSDSDPLGQARNLDELKTVINQAKAVRDHFGKLKDSDYEEDADGKPVYHLKQGNQTLTFTKEQVEQKLRLAEARLDHEAIAARQRYLETRAESKPWERAEAIMPGLFEEGSPANRLMEAVLKDVPQLARLPEWEVFVAHVAKSIQLDLDTRPSKGYPKGRKKIVIYELDKHGKVVPPKRQGGAVDNKPGKPKPKSETPPSGARPPTQKAAASRNGKPSLEAAITRHATSRSESSLRDVLLAETGL